MAVDASNTEIWLFVVGSLAAVIGALGLIILNSIRSEIKDIRVNINEITADLRDGVSGLDRRVTHVEAHLGLDYPFKRRKNNGDNVELFVG